MRASKFIFGAVAAAALLAGSVTSADARWFHHRGPGPVLGLLGGVVVGAATIATLPFAIVGAAVNPGPPSRRYSDQGYYGPPQGGAYAYGPPPPPPPPAPYSPRQYGYAQPPPGYYQRYGPPSGYGY
jgi:hypothetical protein